MDGPVTEPLLRLEFLSHGTLLMDDLDATRRFFEEFLGIEVVRTSTISFAIRLNSDTSVACVALSKKVRQPGREYLRYYNIGLTVGDAVDVARAHELAFEHKDSYDIRSVGDTESDGGCVNFLIEDRDGNFWQIMNDQAGQRDAKPIGTSILKANRMVHCACEVVDLAQSRKLFEEVLGLEVVAEGPKSLALRLNSTMTIRVKETGERRAMDKHGSHMGFDVASEEEVDAAREKLLTVQEQYGISRIARPKHGHGNYSFYFIDRDDNHWEILDNPKGGYTWRFEQGGDLERPFLPNNSDATHWRELVDPETNEIK